MSGNHRAREITGLSRKSPARENIGLSGKYRARESTGIDRHTGVVTQLGRKKPVKKGRAVLMLIYYSMSPMPTAALTLYPLFYVLTWG